IHIDGDRILRQIGVVQTIIAHIFTLGPAAQPTQVLAQPIGQHVATIGIPLEFRRWPLLDIEQRQTTLDGTIEQLVTAARLEPHPQAQVRVAGEHRCLPAAETLPEQIPDLAVERYQRIRIPKTLSIGRIDDEQAWFIVNWSDVAEKTSLDVNPVIQ